mmetsp:Transcript_12865/g.40670  ORF Transcript_12865/g.40670 Transcript_12865/m.40670 type:complete len:264 (-) Transcript_12865:248-1039(-)
MAVCICLKKSKAGSSPEPRMPCMRSCTSLFPRARIMTSARTPSSCTSGKRLVKSITAICATPRFANLVWTAEISASTTRPPPDKLLCWERPRCMLERLMPEDWAGRPPSRCPPWLRLRCFTMRSRSWMLGIQSRRSPTSHANAARSTRDIRRTTSGLRASITALPGANSRSFLWPAEILRTLESRMTMSACLRGGSKPCTSRIASSSASASAPPVRCKWRRWCSARGGVERSFANDSRPTRETRSRTPSSLISTPNSSDMLEE